VNRIQKYRFLTNEGINLINEGIKTPKGKKGRK
jgi:hypothetical protein